MVVVEVATTDRLEVMAALVVVLVVEMVKQTVQEVAMHRHLVKVMMVVIVEAVELTLFVAVAEAALLVQLVAIVGMTVTQHIVGAVTVELVQLLQLQVHL
jgi:hypothetical protein